jgi:integrase
MAAWLDEARIKQGRFVTIEKLEAGGSLQARVNQQGVIAFYFRAKAGGQEVRANIGRFDPKAPPRSIHPTLGGGLSLTGARAAAILLAVEHTKTCQAGGLAARRRQESAQRRVIKQERNRMVSMTLDALCDAYGAWLDMQSKTGSKDARSTLGRFLIHNPLLAGKPARDVNADDLVVALRKMHEAGKVREPGKVRAYLHAAYKAALTARTSPSIPQVFINFGVQHNPVAVIPATAARANKDPLSKHELHLFWQVACGTPGHRGALMRLHVLTGGQRLAQLLRLRRDDAQGDNIILHDHKGRRAQPRRHVLPLLAEAQADLSLFTSTPYVFSTDGGLTSISTSTYWDWATDAVGNRIQRFTPKRLRSGIETALAALGVPEHIRAQLQSHGLGGVQARHYDGYDYLAEKLAALKALREILICDDSA